MTIPFNTYSLFTETIKADTVSSKPENNMLKNIHLNISEAICKISGAGNIKIYSTKDTGKASV